MREMFDDERSGDTTQIKALAAGENCRQNFLRVGGGEHELHMRRRFFERLEQRVERRCREHVNLVNDVDLELAAGGNVLAGLAQLTHLLHTVIARAVNLQHVHRATIGNFFHARIVVVKVHLWAAGAIERLGKDARDGGLARAARPAE